MGSPPMMEQVRRANEQMREQVRFVLREMSGPQWNEFKTSLLERLSQPAKAEEVEVIELVFRIGESVSNVEIAALALGDKVSGRKLIQPEEARRNAVVKGKVLGAQRMDPDAAYQEAKRAVEQATDTASRAENTLAYGYVEPSAPYKHARNTVFRMVDCILEDPELMAEVVRIYGELLGVRPVSQAQMRWALHRMPMAHRMQVIQLIPLNIILMFCHEPGRDREAGAAFSGNPGPPAGL